MQNNLTSYQIPKRSLFKRITSRSEFSVFVALVVLIVVMSIASPVFMTTKNIFNVLNQISRYGIIAAGMALIIIAGGIDLSVGYAVGFTACYCAYFSSAEVGMPWPLVLIVTMGMGALIGIINGLLVTRVKIVPFIVTLAMGKILSGLTLLLTRGRPIFFSSGLSVLGWGYLGPVPIPVIIMFVCIVAGSIFTAKTLTGRNIYAIGNNERAASLSGINVKRLKVMTYIITSMLCALCGIIVAGNLESADANLGTNYETDVIAAVVIGGVAMSGGEGTVWGSLIGAAIMGILKNAFVLLGVSAYWQTIVIGIVIIGAVTIDSVRTARQSKVHKERADKHASDALKQSQTEEDTK
ncbi:MAG: ABC transporter permease [Christensenellales bacterium]|jgi:ribose transport system permease protein